MAFKPTSEDLRLCAAVARTSSLANAARALGINQSTAFRRLNALEDGLGVRLFERLPEGYVTTNAGARLLEVAERVVADIDDVSREIAGQDLELSGSVRLTTTDDLALEAIPPILADFARQHPQVCVELMVEARTYDMHRREAEIAIRVTPAPPEQLIGRHVADVGVRIYAAEALLERYGDDCLDRAPWIGWQEGAGPTASWMAANVHADGSSPRRT